MFSKALIPAAGAGLRAYPATNYQPKVMLEIFGKPIIQRNIEMLRDQLGIHEFVIITGYMAEVVENYLQSKTDLGVTLHFIRCKAHQVGLANGILMAKDFFHEPFVTVLGDEVYLDSNHGLLKQQWSSDLAGICGLLSTTNQRLIQKNYSVDLEGDKIVSLVEKPTDVKNDVLGLGTYAFSPHIFAAIENTPASPRSGKIELTDAISNLTKNGTVKGCFLKGQYFNINTVEDYNEANYHARSANFSQHNISVVIPAYNEEESVASVVKDFLPFVDEVLVVNNQSKDRTAPIALEAGARVENVKLIGYGDTIRHGLSVAKGDILVIVEADHSFRAKDLDKFLEYLKDADMVVGTRTTRQLIEQGANMKGLVRLGNIVVGKMIELLWWNRAVRFTDVGCSYRAIWKEEYKKIAPRLKGLGPEFSPEMMIEVLNARKRIIEIPISYHPRFKGESKHSKSFYHLSKTALKMLKIIFSRRLNGL